MLHGFLRDPEFHHFLEIIDRSLADEARAAGCGVCGGVLHSAVYLRRPRGGPHQRGLRFSFCCARDGCRRRTTPGSVRFLARRVWLGVVVVLASALRHGVTRSRFEALHEHLAVSERTVARWRSWWLGQFAESRFWKAVRARFAEPVESSRLPASLLERFAGDERSRLLGVLRLLLPITGGKGLAGQSL